VTKDEGRVKLPLDHEALYPAFAILNPEFTYTLPPYQTACGISDIMVHVMERYFTRVKNVGITDRLCEGVLKNMIENAPVVMADPENYAARSEIMWSGAIAHNNLLNTGRTGDWASHMIEHELSGQNDVAHGAGLSVIMPAWMKYVYKHDIDIFVQYAVRVWNVEQKFGDAEWTALEGIRRLEEFYKGLGLPIRLSEIGFSESDYGTIAEKCRKFDAENETVGNFVALKKSDIVNILKIAQ
jgi:alcohol dehydrogenase YqhD (iron-dependent ADH family)